MDHGGNTAVTVLVGEGGAWQVRALNDDGHLGNAPVPDEETTVVGLARHGESEANTVGVWHGPPKALDEPNPASSIRTISTLGAP